MCQGSAVCRGLACRIEGHLSILSEREEEGEDAVDGESKTGNTVTH